MYSLYALCSTIGLYAFWYGRLPPIEAQHQIYVIWEKEEDETEKELCEEEQSPQLLSVS